MLILRPPQRKLLERGPPASVRKALQQFERKEQLTAARATELAQGFGFASPEAWKYNLLVDAAGRGNGLSCATSNDSRDLR